MSRAARRLTALGAACLAAGAVAVGTGATRVPLADLARLLTGRGAAVPDTVRLIVLDVRIPRAMVGACVGALLGTAGALLQGFLRNPLAEPYLLGVSSGAALAVTAAILLNLPLFFHGVYLLPPLAFAGALVTLAAVYALAQVRGRIQVTTLVLAGVVVSAFLSAAIMLVAALSSAHYFEVLSWLMGHLQPLARGTQRWLAGYAVVGLGLALAQARDLNALALGEEEAAALGVNIERAKVNLFVLSSLLTGVAVAASGLIGFVGLVAPHAARLLVGPDHRRLLPAAAVAGATLLLLSDAVARTVLAPTELPVGVVTALVGGPFFLWLLVRHVRDLAGPRA